LPQALRQRLFRRKGNFIFAPNWFAAVGFNSFDDGRGTIVWFNAVTGQGRMFHMQTQTTYTWFDFDGTPFAEWLPIGAADVLGRGRDQFAMINPITNDVALWGFNGYTLDFSTAFAIPDGWELRRPLVPPAP
jgi:hypothetical protein